MEDRQIGHFFIRKELFEQVKEHMATALKRTVSVDEVDSFLARNTPLLSSIVGYDEVDTEDRSLIWELCSSDRSFLR